MTNDNTNPSGGNIEDYGTSDSEGGSGSMMGGSGSQGGGSSSGGSSGGSAGGTGSGVSSEGEQFGEFGSTGTGTDLTIEMENSDVRTGLVKGGESGADDAAGPGQYGGEAGGLNQS